MTGNDRPLDIARYWLPEPGWLPRPEDLVTPRATDGWCYFFPCPRCGFMETLERRLRWTPAGPGPALYLCGSCEQVFDHKTAAELLAMGEWRRTREAAGGSDP
jgi:hypothetical protein